MFRLLMAKCIVNFVNGGLEAHPPFLLGKVSREHRRNTIGEYFNCVPKGNDHLVLEMMEVNAGYSRSNEKQLSECRKSADKGKKHVEKDESASVFVNHAAIAWLENRRRWTGDKSQQSRKFSKDQIISWSTTYEELLLTNEPFSEPIPLPEMVNFLVDIWHDDGLFD